MSEMVERVAAAIVANSRNGPEAQAKAAIAALRKPTTLMLIAAGRTNSGCELEFHDVDIVWQAMIDEALK